MPDFDEKVKDIINQLGPLAKILAKEYVEDATEDGKEFINKIRDDLKRWTEMLTRGEIPEDEFVSLVKGKKDLAEMKLLKQKGLASIKIDQFKGSVTNLIVNSIL